MSLSHLEWYVESLIDLIHKSFDLIIPGGHQRTKK